LLGEKITVEIEEIYHGAVRAFPSEIKQADQQLVVVEINLYYSSPYQTILQNSRMNIGTKKTESFSKHGKLDGNAIKFTEQKDIEGRVVKLRIRAYPQKLKKNGNFLQIYPKIKKKWKFLADISEN